MRGSQKASLYVTDLAFFHKNSLIAIKEISYEMLAVMMSVITIKT